MANAGSSWSGAPSSLAIGILAVVAVAQATPMVVERFQDQVVPVPLSPGELVPDITLRSQEDTAQRLSQLGGGCRLIVFMSTCPAATEILADFAEAGNHTSVDVLGVTLPLTWVAGADDVPMMELLAQGTVRDVRVVTDEAWETLRIDYSPQFYLVDDERTLIARGAPIIEYLRDIPSELMHEFALRCGGPQSPVIPARVR